MGPKEEEKQEPYSFNDGPDLRESVRKHFVSYFEDDSRAVGEEEDRRGEYEEEESVEPAMLQKKS